MADHALRRGDVVVCAMAGDYGKPRPALIVQANAFNDTHASVTLCPITSEITELDLFRVMVQPTAGNGLRKASEVMVDKVTTVRRNRVSREIGRLSPGVMARVDAALRTWLELGSAVI